MSGAHEPSMVGIPETLLPVIVEAARGVLSARDADALGPTLRPLARVDRRAASSATVRRQFAAALAREAEFRGDVAGALMTQPAVAAALEGWHASTAVEAAGHAADAGELAVLAAALWAGQPGGWEVGIGVCAAVESERAARASLGAERDGLMSRIASLEADAQSAAAREAARAAEIEALTTKLGAERAARRNAEQRAEQVDVARDESRATEQQLRTELAAAREQYDSARVRADELNRALAEARANTSAPVATPPAPAVSADDLATLADAAADLTHRLRDAASRAETASAPPAPAMPRAQQARPAAPARRTKPTLPGGMVADSVDGARAMLAAKAADGARVTLVVDGYNVAKLAWPQATTTMQRDRLEVGLQQLHQRLKCTIVCCYDGDGSVGVPRRRTPGVHVRFSARDQEADELVVDTVKELPKRVPAIVASSDAWVRQHAESEGAMVVSAATAAALITAAGRR